MKFYEMTASELRGVDRDGTLVLLPIAACEQHGPHLPTATDTIICGAIAAGVEKEMPDSVLLLPVLWLGASQHHLPWGGTLTATLETYTTLLCEIIQPLLQDGYRRVLLLNGHGGNVDPMHVALRRLQPRYPQTLLSAAAYWSIAKSEIAEILTGEDKGIGHACEAETSLVMHLRPELVRADGIHDASQYLPSDVHGVFVCRDMKQRTERGATGRPDLATAEKGKSLYEGIVARVTTAVQALLTEG